MSDTAIFLVVLLMFAVGAGIIFSVVSHRDDSSPRKRKLKLHDEEIVAIADVDHDVPVHFSGKGTWSSKPIQLNPGNYRLRYDFSQGMSVRVGLVSSFDGENETLLIKSGSGIQSFGVEMAGRYIFTVQPADESAEWTIEFQHLTRYGISTEPDDEILDPVDEDEHHLYR